MEANYCLNCGSPLKERDIDGVMRKACPECSFVHWGNYSIGVGALVVRDQKVLLVRRAQEPGKGYWTNPGGYIEQLEPIEQTIVREVQEESGVLAKVTSIVALRDLPRNIHNVYIAYAMDYISGDPIPDGVEVDQAGFFNLQEMESMNVAPFTKWLVHIALEGQSAGLYIDNNPIVTLQDHGLFSVSTRKTQ